MKTPVKPPTKKEHSSASRTMSESSHSGLDSRHREASKLRQADKMLTRIERQGHALSAGADRLLRRVR
jgi:hypothetical protein